MEPVRSGRAWASRCGRRHDGQSRVPPFSDSGNHRVVMPCRAVSSILRESPTALLDERRMREVRVDEYDGKLQLILERGKTAVTELQAGVAYTPASEPENEDQGQLDAAADGGQQKGVADSRDDRQGLRAELNNSLKYSVDTSTTSSRNQRCSRRPAASTASMTPTGPKPWSRRQSTS